MVSVREGQVYDVLTFFLELPVKGKGKVLSVSANGIDWAISGGKLIPAVRSEREFFFVSGNKVCKCDVIFLNSLNGSGELFCSTTVPVRRADPRFLRQFPRVAVSSSDNARLMLSDLENEHFKVLDVSEFGLSFAVPHKVCRKLTIGSMLDGMVSLRGITFPFAGKVASMEEISEYAVKIGLLLLDANFAFLKEYVARRQREIARILEEMC